MPITQDAHNAIARAADLAMRALDAQTTAIQGAVNSLTGGELVERILLILSTVPRMMEERDMVTRALDRYKYTAHANRRRAAKHRLARGTSQEGDAAFTHRMRAKLQRQTIGGAHTSTLDAINSPPMPRLEPGDYIVRDDGAIISELPAPKPPISQHELNAMIDKAAAMLAQPVQHGPGHIPDLLSRIPKAPATIAAEEAARQALENGGGED